jgi:hypothetical protein
LRRVGTAGTNDARQLYYRSVRDHVVPACLGLWKGPIGTPFSDIVPVQTGETHTGG